MIVNACLDRKKNVDVAANAVSVGWHLSKNRNRILFWDEPGLERVQWWETGTIFVPRYLENANSAKKNISCTTRWDPLEFIYK